MHPHGGTPATVLLDRQRVSYRVHNYDHRAGGAYGPEAAAALGVDPARVVKTLVAQVDVRLTVAVLPVTGSPRLKVAAAVGGQRAAMAELTAAERATGYVAGGISPLGPRTRLPLVVDQSAMAWPTVFRGGERRGWRSSWPLTSWFG